MKNKRLNATFDRNTYMRNYMRTRNNATPRKEPYEAKRAEFERIIQAGGHGTIDAASRQAGVHRETGRRWLREIRAKARAGAC